MHGSSYVTPPDRQTAIEDIKKHIAGQPLPPVYPDAEDKDFSGYEVEDAEPKSIAERNQQIVEHARRRDAIYGMASGPWLRAQSLGGSLRDTYEGGKKLIEGGVS